MLCDLRDVDKAACTLESITGVSSEVWSAVGKKKTVNVDDDIGRFIKENGGYIPRFDDLEMVITHVTTSGNGCASILKDGIIDLKSAYQKRDSELRIFLESKGIEILLDYNCLKYRGMPYDISVEDRPWNSESEEHAAWKVGLKFHCDYNVCGFFSVSGNIPYSGNVHRRPEILMNLDNLLKTDLQREWMQSHQAYEIVFRVPFRDILYASEYSDTENKVMSYLRYAYKCVSEGPDNKEVPCKKGVEISPDQILECNRFTLWV